MREHRTSPSCPPLDGPCPMPTYNSRPRRHVDEPPSSWVSWCAEKGWKTKRCHAKMYELYELGSKSTLDFSTRGNTSLIEVVPEFFLKFFKQHYGSRLHRKCSPDIHCKCPKVFVAHTKEKCAAATLKHRTSVRLISNSRNVPSILSREASLVPKGWWIPLRFEIHLQTLSLALKFLKCEKLYEIWSKAPHGLHDLCEKQLNLGISFMDHWRVPCMPCQGCR